MSDDILGYIPALRAYSRALCRSVPDAEDLVQETLLRAIENVHQYRPGTNMRAWLFTIMRNRFLTNCRKSARERTGAADCVSSSVRVQVKPGQDWHMQAREMQAALREMPPITARRSCWSAPWARAIWTPRASLAATSAPSRAG